MSTKAQLYLTDFIIGILIFGLFTALYYLYVPNIEQKIVEKQNDLLLEAKTISVSLVSQGVPKDWDRKAEENIIRIGLTNKDQTINMSKLERFYNLSYIDTKNKFNIINNYYVYLRDGNQAPIWVNSSGNMKNGTGYYEPELAEKVSRISRIVAFNKTLTELVVYVWK